MSSINVFIKFVDDNLQVCIYLQQVMILSPIEGTKYSYNIDDKFSTNCNLNLNELFHNSLALSLLIRLVQIIFVTIWSIEVTNYFNVSLNSMA